MFTGNLPVTKNSNLMARRKLGEINAGSMADIAFLLLIFFLVTTTMDVDSGIMRQLPPYEEKKEESDPIKERNVFLVFLNKNNQLMVEGELMEGVNASKRLTEKVKEFITNPADDENLSEGDFLQDKYQEAIEEGEEEKAAKLKDMIDKFGGTTRVSKGVVSLQNDRGTQYGKYIEIQDAIVRAFNELKDEFSRKHFGSPYEELEEEEQKMVRKIIPLSISEAEPRSIG